MEYSSLVIGSQLGGFSHTSGGEVKTRESLFHRSAERADRGECHESQASTNLKAQVVNTSFLQWPWIRQKGISEKHGYLGHSIFIHKECTPGRSQMCRVSRITLPASICMDSLI